MMKRFPYHFLPVTVVLAVVVLAVVVMVAVMVAVMVVVMVAGVGETWAAGLSERGPGVAHPFRYSFVVHKVLCLVL